MMHRPTSFLYLAASLVLGIALGLIWDLIGIANLPFQGTEEMRCGRMGRLRARWASAQRAAWRMLGDLLFCITAAVSLSLLTYALNRGKLRALAVITLAVGFSLWYFSLSRPIRRIASYIGRAVRRRLGLLYAKTLGRAAEGVKRRILLRQRRAYTRKTGLALIAQAKRGAFGAHPPMKTETSTK